MDQADRGRAANAAGRAQAWPPVSHEYRLWNSQLDPSRLSRAARSQAGRGRYEATVTPEIARVEVTLSSSTTVLATDASVEIARFDAELGHEIAPFSAMLLRSESSSSSRIENLSASPRAIADAELTGAGTANATLIVANTRAMQAAVELADHLDPNAILTMHAVLLAQSNPAIAGQWRTDQVWIGGGDFSPHGADFIAPHHERVGPAIDDLVMFMNRDDIPVLAQAAIAHAQFETIHPFPDGNGRTGRALIHSLLRAKELTRNVSVPVSAGLLSDTAGYFAALASYRAGDPEPIIQRLALAAYSAVNNGRQLVADIHAVRARWHEQITARRDSAVWKVADVLVRQPVVDSGLLQRELGVSDTNVLAALRAMEDAGILISYNSGKRSRAWRSPEILESLDAFAVRAGRRRMGT